MKPENTCFNVIHDTTKGSVAINNIFNKISNYLSDKGPLLTRYSQCFFNMTLLYFAVTKCVKILINSTHFSISRNTRTVTVKVILKLLKVKCNNHGL